MSSYIQIANRDGQHYLETNNENDVIFLSSGMGFSIEQALEGKESPIHKNSSLIAPLEIPEIIQEIHTANIQAGAQIITAETYCASYYRQNGDVTLTNSFVTAAANIAEQSRKDFANKPLIAMSLTALEDCYEPESTPDTHTLYTEHARNLKLLEKHGDFTLAETLPSLREAQAIAENAKRPFVTAFTVNNKGTLLDGNGMDTVVETILEPHAFCLGIGINCCSIEGAEKAVIALSEIYNAKPDLKGKQIITYPNGFKSTRQESVHECGDHSSKKQPDRLTPIELSSILNKFTQQGATAVGGCCGTTAEHTKSYVSYINENNRPSSPHI